MLFCLQRIDKTFQKLLFKNYKYCDNCNCDNTHTMELPYKELCKIKQNCYVQGILVNTQ